MTETELADLRAKAEAATPGPWFAIDSIRNKETYIIPGDTEPTFDNEENSFAWGIMVDDPDEGYSIVHGENYHSIEDIQQDIDFIAAANPTTILSLLDDRDRLMAEIARLRADAEWRPISTAPKDRTIELGFDYPGHLFTCSSGYWTDHNGGGWVRQCLYQPTHWRPLPQPPEERS